MLSNFEINQQKEVSVSLTSRQQTALNKRCDEITRLIPITYFTDEPCCLVFTDIHRPRSLIHIYHEVPAGHYKVSVLVAPSQWIFI